MGTGDKACRWFRASHGRTVKDLGLLRKFVSLPWREVNVRIAIRLVKKIVECEWLRFSRHYFAFTDQMSCIHSRIPCRAD